MGIPYSREINNAFEQVTPLVAAGFQVLQTTKDIAILLACIQVLTVILLFFILLALLGLLITISPDMERERRELVNPPVLWLSGWLLAYGTSLKWVSRVLVVFSSIAFGIFMWQGSVSGYNVPKAEEDAEEISEENNDKKGNKKGGKKESKKDDSKDEAESSKKK